MRAHVSNKMFNGKVWWDLVTRPINPVYSVHPNDLGFFHVMILPVDWRDETVKAKFVEEQVVKIKEYLDERDKAVV